MNETSPKTESRDALTGMPWLDALPTTQQLKQLKYESSWNPEAAEQLAKITSRIKELQAAAAADDHTLFYPTDIMVKKGTREKPDEILGYASIGSIPMVNLWLDQKKTRGRESLGMMNMIEFAAKQRGFNTICVPCWKSSPLRPFIENGLGYLYFGETGLFVKTLR